MTKLLLLLIRGYKLLLSPFLPPACRFYPSCSDYAQTAVERHGIFRGSYYAVWRILRCHPFVKGGIDLVP